MKFLYVHADQPHELNTTVWRCYKPASALREVGHIADILYWMDFDVQATIDAKYDVVIFQRYCWNKAVSQVEALKAAGILTVYDFDDDYQTIPESNSGYQLWANGNLIDEHGNLRPLLPPKPIQGHGWIRDLVDVCTTPSMFLANKYDATFLPNMPASKNWKTLRKPKKQRKQLVIGWGGGGSHLDSWKQSRIIRPLLVTAQERNLKIQINGAVNVVEYVTSIKDMMSGKKPMVSFKNYMKAERWPEYLMFNYDLFVIPLAGEYDKARSPIKAMECGLAAVPWIASDNGVYDEFAMFGTLVRNEEDMWYDAINNALNNLDRQQQAALSARNWFMDNYLVENNTDVIMEAYGYED